MFAAYGAVNLVIEQPSGSWAYKQPELIRLSESLGLFLSLVFLVMVLVYFLFYFMYYVYVSFVHVYLFVCPGLVPV